MLGSSEAWYEKCTTCRFCVNSSWDEQGDWHGECSYRPPASLRKQLNWEKNLFVFSPVSASDGCSSHEPTIDALRCEPACAKQRADAVALCHAALTRGESPQKLEEIYGKRVVAIAETGG